MDKYFVTGTGIGNSPSIIKGNKQGVSEVYESHNLYIQYFAEYGIIGLIFYLLYWLGCLRQFRRTKDDKWFLMSMGVVFLIVTFFLNIDKGRTFWIVLAMLNMVWMENKRKLTCKKNKECIPSNPKVIIQSGAMYIITILGIVAFKQSLL